MKRLAVLYLRVSWLSRASEVLSATGTRNACPQHAPIRTAGRRRTANSVVGEDYSPRRSVNRIDRDDRVGIRCLYADSVARPVVCVPAACGFDRDRGDRPHSRLRLHAVCPDPSGPAGVADPALGLTRSDSEALLRPALLCREPHGGDARLLLRRSRSTSRTSSGRSDAGPGRRAGGETYPVRLRHRRSTARPGHPVTGRSRPG